MIETNTPPERRIEADGGSGTRREAYQVRGDRIVAKIKELVHEGNVRHLVIKNEEGKTLIELPVTVGVAGALLVPVWAAVGPWRLWWPTAPSRWCARKRDRTWAGPERPGRLVAPGRDRSGTFCHH